MMIQLAICDDESQAVMLHRRLAEEALQAVGAAATVTTYTASENLLADICDDGFFFDLILLDIEMPGVDGMVLVEKITPLLPQVRVVFITSHVEYAIDAFALNIFRYVPKQELDQRLPQAVQDAAQLIMLEEGRSYIIQTASRLEKLPYKDILYIAREGKNVCFITKDGASLERTSLQQVMERLNAEEFIYIDRGMIVNLIHVMQVKDGFVVLQGGQRLPVSRSHLHDVKERLNRYWGQLI